MTSEGDHQKEEITLTGLAGGNMLAFLAALGAFRVLSLALPSEQIRMSWRSSGGAWRPVLQFPIGRKDTWFSTLVAALGKSRGIEALAFADNPSIDAPRFLEPESAAAKSASILDRASADFMAAFGSAAWCDDKGKVQDTAFRTMQGAGHQHFLRSMRDLVAETSGDQIRSALVEPWVPADERLGIRWDACEDRLYALRWKNPSKETVLTVRGANRLAVEALPLFPVAGAGSVLGTTGFTFPRRGNPRFSFPIWVPPISLDTARSLLASQLIQDEGPSNNRVRPSDLGIQAVYRCERITTGKFRNFTPAFPV